MPDATPLQRSRMNYRPRLPAILHDLTKLKAQPFHIHQKERQDDIYPLFPKIYELPLWNFTLDQKRRTEAQRVGVVLSGGQAPGGHNVIAGLFDALKRLHSESRLFGFLDGPDGIIKGKHIEITEELLAPYRNQGGFDMIGSGRGKIETVEQFDKVCQEVLKLQLDGLVIIGGDDSNTNAALLAEYFLSKKIPVKVIGVPKTIDGDLKNKHIEISFGFDTACKTFSETIASICRDALSAKKYYFFVKLMGRSASHIALECALETHPNMTLIGEEAASEKWTLQELTRKISDMICLRASEGKNYGVLLIPEGIIEFIPEFSQLIKELGPIKIDPESEEHQQLSNVESLLTEASLSCFKALPQLIRHQLLMDRDPHGNLQVSKIETERLFIETVTEELDRRKKAGSYHGKFSSQPLFCGYEGRSCLPTNFDCQYCYALGYVAALLIDLGATGYMSCIKNLAHPVEHWQIAGIPLASMIQIEERKGKFKPVIKKALVDLTGNPFQVFAEHRQKWLLHDEYRYPGPVQFFGPAEISESITATLELEAQGVDHSFL